MTAVLAADPAEPEIDVLDSPSAARSAVRGSALRTSAYLGATLANALVLPFLFRYLGVVRAGQYVTVVSLITILAGIVETGLTGVSLRVYSVAGPGERPRLMRELVSMRLAVLLIGIALVGTFAVVAGYPPTVLAGLGLGSLGVVLEGIGSTYNVWLSTNLHLGWIALSNIVRQLVAAGLTLLLVIRGAPLVDFFAVFVPAGLAQLLISAMRTRGSSPLAPSTHVSSWWRLTREGAPYVIAMALGFVYFRVPVVMMSILAPGKATGYFGAAFRLVETLTLMTIVLTAALPILTRAADRDADRHLYGLRKMVQVSLIVGGGLAVATATGASAAIHILAGSTFDSSIGPLRVMAAVLLVKFVTTAWGFGLLSVGRYRQLLVANGVATLVSVMICAVAIPVAGAYGGVAATLGAELTLAVGYRVILRGALTTAGFPTRTTIIIALSALLAVGVILIPMPDFLRPLVGVGIFTIMILAAGEMPREALELIPRLSRS